MSAIVNQRDILLQATSPRVVPIPIPIGNIDGLDGALANAGRRVEITASATTFAGANNPTAITLTAKLGGDLVGIPVWSVQTGTATLSPSGLTCVVNNATMVTASVVIRARVTMNSINYDGTITLTKLGSLAASDFVNLQTQVAGQLAVGNVTGLGALALLNTVNLNTQTTGALDALTQVNNLGTLATQNTVNLATQTSGSINALTQVNNLGNLAFVNGLAANQIGAGQLAAGVVYAGEVVASQVTSGSFSGKTFSGGSFTGVNVQMTSGTIGGITLNGQYLTTGNFTGWGWPASGGGFALGPLGLLMGNYNTGGYFQLTSDGQLFTPNLSMTSAGVMTFSGKLQVQSAASGARMEITEQYIRIYDGIISAPIVEIGELT